MSQIQVLDCTLRDGGYCNDCHFGFKNEKKIVRGLIDANLDIIECGFYLDRIDYEKDRTRFSSLEQVAQIIPENRRGKTFVLLTDYGKFDPERLPVYDGTSIDGLRIAFHKKDWTEGLQACQAVKDKGYKVFAQAMVSLSYSDEEFLELINKVNEIEPYAFYIVDSFGMMKQKDLIRLFYMAEHNLKPQICIGFHAHNNMQLAYSNAQKLVHIHTDRNIIIDSSVYGMGRGAGNLNTELFLEYLNENMEGRYNLKPLWLIIDEILNAFYRDKSWGYSLPNYLSAKHNTHPNYANYLDEKKTLTVNSMDDIFSMMDDSKRCNFDKKYIEELYIKYMDRNHIQESHLKELRDRIYGQPILIIAPGRSSYVEKEKIISKMSEMLSISINYNYPEADADFIFLSNLRRFRELEESKYKKCIVTSNIPSVDVYLQTQYGNLLNDKDSVRDNSGMMLIKFLVNLGVRKIYIAGIDGYSVESSHNFADKAMDFYVERATCEAMNSGMIEALKEFKKEIEIEYVTTPKYVYV